MWIVVPVAVLLGMGAMLFLLRGPVPFFDKGFRIYTARDEHALRTMVEVLRPYLKPRYRIDGPDISRVLMSDNMTVINYQDTKLRERMGNAAAGLAVVDRHPQRAAERAVTALREGGYEAEILGELLRDVPRGSMVVVSTNALTDTVLLFRKHFFRMGKRPPKYR